MKVVQLGNQVQFPFEELADIMALSCKYKPPAVPVVLTQFESSESGHRQFVSATQPKTGPGSSVVPVRGGNCFRFHTRHVIPRWNVSMKYITKDRKIVLPRKFCSTEKVKSKSRCFCTTPFKNKGKNFRIAGDRQ